MDASELRNFSTDELSARVKQWKGELFRSRFKAQAAEARDTSVVRKLRRDIARALTIMQEIRSGKVVAKSATGADQVVAKPKAKKATGTKAGKKAKKD